jgi:hypothetical protein
MINTNFGKINEALLKFFVKHKINVKILYNINKFLN